MNDVGSMGNYKNPMNRVNRGNPIHGVFGNVSQPGCFNPGRPCAERRLVKTRYIELGVYLIDGYNLFYQTDFSEKEDLINALDKFCRTRHKDATIVFDGRCPYDLNTDFVQVIFTGDADEGIAEVLAKCNNPSQLVLVSSDKELRYLARQKRIETIRAEEFDFSVGKTKLSGDEKGRGFLTESEAREQLREFNNFEK